MPLKANRFDKVRARAGASGYSRAMVEGPDFDEVNAGPAGGERSRAQAGQPREELAALAARVAELERVVAALLSESGVMEEAASVPLRTGMGEQDAAAAVLQPREAAFYVSNLPPPFPSEAPNSLRDKGSAERGAALENRLGSQVFNLIGVVAIIIGTSWALKLAIEHGLIGPAARVVLGLAIGAAAVLWSERFRRRGYAAFSYTLKAVGSGVLYLVLWAAMQIYHLLPAPAALAAMVLVTTWNAWMAWTQDAELLAAYALAGGLATPVLLSTGGDHETFLFTYLAVIDAATVLLVRERPWRRLLIPAYLATVAYFIGWYAEFFHIGAEHIFDGQSGETTLFVSIFFLLFALVSVGVRRGDGAPGEDVIADGLTPLGNAAFVGLALYSVFQDSGLHAWLPWLMAGLAAIFLGLMRVQRSRLAAGLHLVAAVVFLTVAIPLKASGHTLTAAWMVEALALYWAATRVAAQEGARQSLVSLGAACYALGLGSLVLHWWWFGGAGAGFWNANLASALLAVGVAAGAVWLAQSGDGRAAESGSVAAGALVAADGVALLLAFGVGWSGRVPTAFANTRFYSALVGLAALGAVVWAGSRLRRRWAALQQVFAYLAGTTLVLFNLTVILVIERELDALFFGAGVDEGLERSLAISGFLMVYGALLLAAGFWRRSAMVRWQGLLLLVFTIFKVFLYDISGLSQGYRVVSFLALGALLLTVSFAYQKDWMGLKQSAAGLDQTAPDQAAPGREA